MILTDIQKKELTKNLFKNMSGIKNTITINSDIKEIDENIAKVRELHNFLDSLKIVDEESEDIFRDTLENLYKTKRKVFMNDYYGMNDEVMLHAM